VSGDLAPAPDVGAEDDVYAEVADLDNLPAAVRRLVPEPAAVARGEAMTDGSALIAGLD
jgi:hypothetical protein